MFKKNRLWVIGSIIIAVIGVLFILERVNVTVVQQATVRRGNLQEYLKLQGKVELERHSKVYSKYTGVIESLGAMVGEAVNTRTEMASLTAIDPELGRAQLERSRIAVTAARKDYEYLQDKVARVRILHQEDIISEQEMKDLEEQLAVAESNLNNAEQQLKIAGYDLLLTSRRSSGTGRGAAVDQSGAKIYSGMNGTVLTKYVELGDLVQPGTPLYEVGDYDSAYIRVDVLTDDAGKIRLGQRARISGQVLKDRTIKGAVIFIAPQAERSLSSLGLEQQRLELRIAYDSKSVGLKPGYEVDVNLITASRKAALYIPDKAIFELNNGDHGVFVVKNGRVELRPVKKGIVNDIYAEIITGLRIGEIVVVDPDNDLKPGMRVAARAKAPEKP